MERRELVREAIKANINAPSRTIARMLHEKYPEYSVDSWRNIARTLRGNNGENKRKQLKDKSLVRPNQDSAVVGREYNLQPVDLTVKPYVFKYKKPLILSDIHLPYHDLDAVVAAVNKGVDEGVDSILLNGDTLDFYQVSRFSKAGNAPSIREEREMFWEFISYLKDSIDVPIIFKVGNHEDRLALYIRQNAPQFADLHEYSLKSFLNLDELGIDYVESRQKIIMGNLTVLHGHEAGDSIFSPVNPARGAFLKYKASTLAGHNHQSSSHFESNIRGELTGCWSTGCLCQMTPEYRPFAYTKWNHGFAIVRIEDDGSFDVQNFRITNGNVYT
jgi:predicted phosphodiesterase